MGVCFSSNKLKRSWADFRSAEPGTRFQRFHDAHRSARRPWLRAVYLGFSFASFGVGVVLTFIPGPAVVFFVLSAALLAAQSAWLARRLDAAEAWLRRALGR